MTEDFLWGTRSVRATFLRFIHTSPISEAECPHKPMEQSEFFHEYLKYLGATLRFREPSRPRRTFYQELVKGVASNPLCAYIILSASEVRSFWSWALAANYLSFRFPRDRLRMRYLSVTWASNQAGQIYPTVFGVNWQKQLRTPSTTVLGYAPSRIMSAS